MYVCTHGMKCFKCKDGIYDIPKVDLKFDGGVRYLGSPDINQCTKCGFKIKTYISSYSDEIDGNRLVEEVVNIDIKKLNGKLEDVLEYAKEMSILYDNAYFKISHNSYNKKFQGMRLETDIEKGKRKLKELKEKEKEKLKSLKLKEERQKRFLYLKEKHNDIYDNIEDYEI